MTDKERRAFLHACLADAKECTHKPYTRAAAQRKRGGSEGRDGQGREDEDEDAKDGAGAKDSSFLYRMDAQERAK